MSTAEPWKHDDYPTTNHKWFQDAASPETFARNAGARDLFETYVPFIVRQLERKGLSLHDAEEVAQNVLLELVNKAAKYQQPGLRRFRDELRIITARRGIDFLRLTKKLATVGSSSYFEQLAISGSDEAQVFEREQQAEVCRKALLRLQAETPPLHYEAFRLQTLENPKQSGKAVAVVLGITLASAHQHKSRCLKRLREIVQELGGDGE